MKPYEGYKSESNKGNRMEMLPEGPYIAGITGVKIEGAEPDQTLVIRVEIVEGEYTGYFGKRYQSEQGGRFEPKYKGDYRLRIPNAANPKSQHPGWDVSTFNGAIWAIEQSNPGYHWDWNEQGLKGKYVGINMRYGEYNGNAFTRIGRLESVQEIRDGKIRPMKHLQPRYDNGDSSVPAGFSAVETEVPF